MNGAQLLDLPALRIRIDRLPVVRGTLVDAGAGSYLLVVNAAGAAVVDRGIVDHPRAAFCEGTVACAAGARPDLAPGLVHAPAPHTFVDGRSALYALSLKRTPVDPRLLLRLRQRKVGVLLPKLTQTFGRAFFTHAEDTLAGFLIPVPDDQMTVRVLGVLALFVEGGKPRCPAFGDRLGIGADQRQPLLLVQLPREGQHDLIDDAGVLSVGVFCGAQESHSVRRGSRHSSTGQPAQGTCSRNVFDVRGGGVRLGLRGLAHGAVVQAVDSHTRDPLQCAGLPANP